MPPIACTFQDMPLSVYPPSPTIEALNDLLRAYTSYFPMLQTILPLLSLWTRSHDITTSEMTEPCLALMVIAFLQECFELEDLQSFLPVLSKHPRSHHIDWIERPIKAKRGSTPTLVCCDLRIPQRNMPPEHVLRSVTMGHVLWEFFR